MIRVELDCGFAVSALLPHWTARSLNLEVGTIVNIHIPADAVHLIPQSAAI
jgi:hypothetical protein